MVQLVEAAVLSRSLLSQDPMTLGYTTRMSDVEHTAKNSADAITPMMHIDPDNRDGSARAHQEYRTPSRQDAS